MRPINLLLLLISGASITGALLHARLIGKQSDAGELSVEALNKITTLELQLTQLQEENSTLRELANSRGDIIIDQEWLAFIEKETGFRFKTSPQISKGIVDEMIKFAATEWLYNYGQAGLKDRDYAFDKIGLLPEGQGNMEIQLSLLSSSFGYTRAVFDYATKTIIVPSDFDTKNLSDRKYLTHVLVIALLDQHFPQQTAMSDDAFIARRMVTHGNAIITTQAYSLYSKQQLELTGATFEDTISAEDRRDSLEKNKAMPLYLKTIVSSPGFFGRDFIEAQHTKDNTRRQAIELAFNKATSTLSVIKLAETPRPTFSSSEDAILSTTIGALGILSHAQQGELIENPLELAKEYVSDHFELFANETEEQSSSRIAWTIQFASQKAANKFADHLIDLRPKLEVKRSAGTLLVSFSELF